MTLGVVPRWEEVGFLVGDPAAKPFLEVFFPDGLSEEGFEIVTEKFHLLGQKGIEYGENDFASVYNQPRGIYKCEVTAPDVITLLHVEGPGDERGNRQLKKTNVSHIDDTVPRLDHPWHKCVNARIATNNVNEVEHLFEVNARVDHFAEAHDYDWPLGSVPAMTIVPATLEVVLGQRIVQQEGDDAFSQILVVHQDGVVRQLVIFFNRENSQIFLAFHPARWQSQLVLFDPGVEPVNTLLFWLSQNVVTHQDDVLITTILEGDVKIIRCWLEVSDGVVDDVFRNWYSLGGLPSQLKSTDRGEVDYLWLGVCVVCVENRVVYLSLWKLAFQGGGVEFVGLCSYTGSQQKDCKRYFNEAAIVIHQIILTIASVRII